MSPRRLLQRTATVGVAVLSLSLISCGFFSALVDVGDSAPQRRMDPSKIIDAIPRVEAKSARGNHSPYTVFGKQYHVWPSADGYRQRGEASWYGVKFHGRLTSNGERYDMYKMTAAHKNLPIPSYVEVKNLDNGRRIIVRVNDRGPFHGDRIIDLSYAAATKLGMLEKGTARVEVAVLDARVWRRQQRLDGKGRAASSPSETPSDPAFSVELSAGQAAALPSEAPSIESAKPEVVQAQANSVSSGGMHAVEKVVLAEEVVHAQASPEVTPRWYLQLAALGDLAMAEALQKRLMAITASIEMSPGVVIHIAPGSQSLYRVRLGPLSSRTVAEQIKQHPALDSFANMYPVAE